MTVTLKQRLKIMAMLFAPLTPLTGFTYFFAPIGWVVWSPITLTLWITGQRAAPVYFAFALYLVAPFSFFLSRCLDPLATRFANRNFRLNVYAALAFIHQLIWIVFFGAYGSRFGDGFPLPFYLEPIYGLPPLFAVAVIGFFVSFWLCRQLPWLRVIILHTALYLFVMGVVKEWVKETRVYVTIPAIVSLQRSESGDLTHVHFLASSGPNTTFYASSYINSFVALFREKDHQVVMMGYERDYRYGWPNGDPRLYVVDGWQVTQLPSGLFHPYLKVDLPPFPRFVWGLADDERRATRRLPEVISSEIFKER